MFENAKNLIINEKVVESIYLDGNGILYHKPEDDKLILYFRGTSAYLPDDLRGDDIVIDWGDGSTSNYDNTNRKTFYHEYSDFDDHLVTCTGVTLLGYGGYNNTNLISVIIPKSVPYLAESCFAGCYNLENISIPDSIDFIGVDCFYGCSSLTSISLPDIDRLESGCFEGCYNLFEIIIPETVQSIEASCFSGCNRLYSLNIPESVSYLGENWFAGVLNSIINFNWTSNIVNYDSNWSIDSSVEFSIPYGTTQAYVDAGYPSDRLIERSE